MIFQNKFASSLAIAAIHSVTCGILGAIVICASIGYTMSEYQGAALWLVVADHVLLFLEAPVAIVLYWIYHPSPRFEPSHYFVADFLSNGSSYPLVFALCALWSIAFGCLIVYVKHCFKRLARAGQHANGS